MSTTHDVEVLSFGEAALALDVTVELLIAVLAQKLEGFAPALAAELDVLIANRLPTPGTQAAIERLRNHVIEAGGH